MRFVSGLILAIALAASAAPPAAAEDRALVVGINSYPGITLGGRPNARNLRGAVLDATSFATFLHGRYGFDETQVKLLTDAQASKSAILDAFETWLIEGTEAGDRAVFYLAGHGAQATDLDGDEPEGDRFDEALAPADAAGELGRAPMELENLLLDDELGELVKRLHGRHLMVVVDACHAGTITRGLDVVTPEDTEIRTRTLTPRSPAVATRGVLDMSDVARRAHKVSTRLIEVEAVPTSDVEVYTAIWTATASSQLAFDTTHGGLFTQAFLEGLRVQAADKSGDGNIKAAELLTFVQEASERQCKAHPTVCRHGLTPTLEASEGYLGLVVFPLGSAAAASVKDDAEAHFSHDNDFDLRVEVLPSRPKLGSEVKFRITSSKPGRLLLLDKSPDGSYTQIFPNRFATAYGKSGQLRAGVPLTIPDRTYGFAFEATDEGDSSLIALVVEQSADVGEVLGRNLDLETLKDPKSLIRALAERLRRPLETTLDDEPNRRLRWAFTLRDYVVE